jgi:hypothetical protein
MAPDGAEPCKGFSQVFDELKAARVEIELAHQLIRDIIRECGEMDFDHSNACMNWALCEHSQIECALCRARKSVLTKRSHSYEMNATEAKSMQDGLKASVQIVPDKDTGEAMADEYIDAETEHMRGRESVTEKNNG